jgi:hypothetical protein
MGRETVLFLYHPLGHPDFKSPLKRGMFRFIGTGGLKILDTASLEIPEPDLPPSGSMINRGF